jgi:poly(A) polymerase
MIKCTATTDGCILLLFRLLVANHTSRERLTPDSSNMQPTSTFMGVTPPISTTLPTESETTATTALLEELRRQNTFESAEDTDKRRLVLESLQKICDEFVKAVAREKEPRNEQLVKNARGKIFAYGSFRLGVYGPGSDIDTLIVAPKYVTLDDYFRLFPSLLMSLAPNDAVTNFTAVPEAHVPIMKFEYLGISIDLIFSRLAVLKELPAQNFDLKDMNLLRGLDERELRALNGTRVSDEIMSLIPEPVTFRQALRAIKLWAKRRAIYANIMGFPGGVAWAILIARICQLYPRAASSLVLLKFFALMMKWQWPMPVVLKQIEQGPLSAPVWDQKSPAGKNHLMPIITPAYPSMCATHRVTRSSQQVILSEVTRGFEITAAIMDGKKPWSALFSKHTFFTKDYKYYISIISATASTSEHTSWAGKVESQVRYLVTKLEFHPSIKLARPFTEGFERKHVCTESQVAEVVGGSLAHMVTETNPSNETHALHSPGNDVSSKTVVPVLTTTYYIGLELREGSRSLDLSYQVDDFKRQTYKKGGFDPTVHLLHVVHVRRYDLPDDVFGQGETRPQKRSKSSGNPSKKRSPSDELPTEAKRQQKSAVAAS